ALPIYAARRGAFQPVGGDAVGVICLDARRHACHARQPLSAARLGATALCRTDEHDRCGDGSRRRTLPFCPAPDAVVPVLSGQFADGANPSQGASLLVGQPACNATCHRHLSERRTRAGETHLAARYSVAGTAVRLYTIRVITAGHSLAVFPLHPFD